MLTETKNISAAPLATFRIFFGLLMVISVIRFWVNGWIEKLYLEPSFHFKYWGFEWVKVPPPFWCYALFVLCAISALLVAIGVKYRLSITLFFLSFTYIELMDKTTYLNHYYFISVLSFLMIFLPMNAYFSWDHRKNPIRRVPLFAANCIKFLLAIVYIYAGLAKLNSDWIIDAMPLTIWLPSKYDVPFIGEFLHNRWIAYLFSWAGAFYDLFIVFFLLYKPTRVPAYISVVVFHLLTGLLFPIGMFPYIMIFSALIFFDPPFHQRILSFLGKLIRYVPKEDDFNKPVKIHKLTRSFILLFFVFQMLMPLRFLAYPGSLFWTEQGYRFSWRVMLMEKAGYAEFEVKNSITQESFRVNNRDFLTAFQEKQMATQPDFIIEFAHYLGEYFSERGHENIEIYVESYVALNGEKSRPFIDPTLNLLEVKDSFSNRTYVLAHED